MTIILAQVVLQGDSGLPEDRYINTFHFNGSATEAHADDLADALQDFYNGLDEDGLRVSRFLSADVNINDDVSLIKFYDVGAGPGGTPFYTRNWTLGVSADGNRFPGEVALCLSVKATPFAGANEARRRGRIYVGPLGLEAGNWSAAYCRPSAGFTNCLLHAAQRLHDSAEAANCPWVIYSRVNDSTALVDIAWVDNAMDTQRRRGIAPSGRTQVTL